MKHVAMMVVSVLLLAGWARAGTIVYSYDEQHRLAGANYNNQATVTYEYDKADNLIGFTVLTDSQYFKPFLLYFTLLRPEDGASAVALRAMADTSEGKLLLRHDGLRPMCWRKDYAVMN